MWPLSVEATAASFDEATIQPDVDVVVAAIHEIIL
jgi:hypothetical protein